MPTYEEYLSDPRETLSVEHKAWLDLNDPEHRAALAQAVIAMANHGGGLVILGFIIGAAGELVPDVEREPENPRLACSSERVNGTVERFVDPAIHVDVQFVTRPGTSIEHPILVVPGGHSAPVMAKRDGPNRAHVIKGSVYVRRPGPASAVPHSNAEWRELFERIEQNRRASPRVAPTDSVQAPPSGSLVDSSSGDSDSSPDDGVRARPPSIADRMSDELAPPAPPDNAAIQRARDDLPPEQRYVLDSPISDDRVLTLRQGIEAELAGLPTKRLFTAVGTYSRVREYRPELRYGNASLTFKGPLVEGSNWAEFRAYEMAMSIEHWTLRRLFDLLLERLDRESEPLWTGLEVEQFVRDGATAVRGVQGHPDIVVLLGSIDHDLRGDIANLQDWRDSPIVRDLDMTGTPFIDHPFGGLTILQYPEAELSPSAYVVDLSDFAYSHHDWADGEAAPMRLEMVAIDEAEATTRVDESPDLKRQLFASENQNADGEFSREEAIVHMQLTVKRTLEAAGTISERYRPRTLSVRLRGVNERA